MNRRPLVVLVCAIIVASGCSTSSSGGAEKPDYTPVPDRDLFAQIDQIDGVTGSDVEYNGTFPDTAYVGQVEVTADADPQQVLDAAHAVLRQGRFDVSINLEAVQGNRAIRFDRLPGSGVGTTVNLEKRYGAQPGDGTPPSS